MVIRAGNQPDGYCIVVIHLGEHQDENSMLTTRAANFTNQLERITVTKITVDYLPERQVPDERVELCQMCRVIVVTLLVLILLKVLGRCRTKRAIDRAP